MVSRVRIQTPDFAVNTFTKVSIKRSYKDPLGSADFDIAPPREQWSDHFTYLGKGEEVRVYVNDVPFGRWLIQDVKRSYSAAHGATMHLHCQSLLCTPYEGGVDPDLNLTSANEVSVAAVVLKVMEPYGFTTVSTDASTNLNALTGKPLPGARTPPFELSELKAKSAVAKPDETAYQFLNKILSHIGAVLHVDGEEQLLVTAPDYGQPVAYSLRLDSGGHGGGPDVDMFEGEVVVTETNKGQYSEVAVIGQADPDDDNASRPKPPAIPGFDVLPLRCAYRSSLHPFKPLRHKDKHSSDIKRARNVAHLILGSRASNAYTVSGHVDGWVSRTGRLWTPGTMAHVFVDLEGLDEAMFVLDVTMTLDEHGGQKTQFTLIPSGALILGDKK